MGNPVEVSAKRSGHDHQVTIYYDFGEGLREAAEMFGDDVVFSKFKQAATIDLQSRMRGAMFDEEGEGDNKTLIPVDSETVAERLADWKPGVSTRVTKSPKEKAAEALKKMSRAEIEALLSDLEGDESAA